eukprot:scaffold57648_cov22-Tisochrysis_lutea.AAC.2
MGDLQQTQCIDFIMTSCPSASAGACAECAQQRQSPEAAAGAKPAVHASLESFQNPRIAQDKALACSSQTSRLCGQTMLRMCWQTTRTNHAEVVVLVQVLAHEINSGYKYSVVPVESFNGVKGTLSTACCVMGGHPSYPLLVA